MKHARDDLVLFLVRTTFRVPLAKLNEQAGAPRSRRKVGKHLANLFDRRPLHVQLRWNGVVRVGVNRPGLLSTYVEISIAYIV